MTRIGKAEIPSGAGGPRATESAALHERVRTFVHGTECDGFESLALDIARFQARWSPGFQRLITLQGARLESVSDIPAVPSAAFRLSRVATFPPERGETRFPTSGTTGTPGLHVMRTTRTYRQIALAFGAQALTSAWPGPYSVVALAKPPGNPGSSSLGFMMRAMIEAFDGRALGSRKTADFDPDATERWLLSDRGGVDLAGLIRVAGQAKENSEPLLILATSFALVLLLDALAGAKVTAPERTVIMQTGGFKGQSREVAKHELRTAVARAFSIPEAQVIGEYGMTELTSQLYEGTLPGGVLRAEPDIYLAPRWLEVTPVSPLTLEPVLGDEQGIARFVDLGNVDSAVAIVTDDVVRRSGPGIELCGRRAGAIPRGCSLAIEALLLDGRAWSAP